MSITKYVFVAGSLLGGVTLTSCVSQSAYDSLDAENQQLHGYIGKQRAEIAEKDRQLAETHGKLSEAKGQTARLQGAIKYTIESDLLFKSGSWEMSDKGKETIEKMATKLAPTQTNKLVVNGYTDSQPIGDTLEKQGVESNQELSEKRAEAVRDFLIEKGVSPNLVIARGHGESDPVSTNDTEKGRSENRRVELTLGG